jgi:hypothetical protein
MKTKIFSMLTALVMVLFASCTKQNDAIDQTSLDLADDDAISNAVYEDIFNSVDIADNLLSGFMAKGVDTKSDIVISDTCPKITITHVTDGIWPKVITLDYGTGCQGFFENTRAGKIIISVTGPHKQTGSKRTVTFENYNHNGISIEGTKVVENLGPNSNQNIVFSHKLTGGKLTFPDGRTVERSFELQREWIAGSATRNFWDDEFLVTGTTTGKNLKGVAFTNTITTPLHTTRTCRFIVSGIVKIEREGSDAITINYGEGDCDAKAVISKGDQSKEILLRYKLNQ